MSVTDFAITSILMSLTISITVIKIGTKRNSMTADKRTNGEQKIKPKF